ATQAIAHEKAPTRATGGPEDHPIREPDPASERVCWLARVTQPPQSPSRKPLGARSERGARRYLDEPFRAKSYAMRWRPTLWSAGQRVFQPPRAARDGPRRRAEGWRSARYLDSHPVDVPG